MSNLTDNFDLTYKIGELIVLGGGVVFAVMRTGRMAGVIIQKFEGMLQKQSEEIADLKATVKELSKVVIDLARQEGRINLMEDRINSSNRAMEERQMMTGKRLDELANRFNAYSEGHRD